MEFTVQDTISVYRSIIAEKNKRKRREMFKNDLMQPYEGMFNAFGASLNPQRGKLDALKMLDIWKFVMPERLDQHTLEQLELLERVNAQDMMSETIARSIDVFKPFESKVPLKHTIAGLFLLDASKMDPVDHGYSGYGGIPGYVMMTYGELDEYNLSRLQAALAHEVHHNIRLSVMPWDPVNITVQDYIILEGLAESFGTWLYGQDKIGYYVSEFLAEKLPEARSLIKESLDKKGFGEVRNYLYGDRAPGKAAKPMGIPAFTGYKIGYEIVQACLQKTGKTPVEATFLSAGEIIKSSGYFD